MAETQTCPVCHGSGAETVVVAERPSRRRAGEVEHETRDQTCTECGGSGEVAARPRARRAGSTPAAVHRGGVVREISADLWVEDLSATGSAILHARSYEVLERVARTLGSGRRPTVGRNGVSTLFVPGRERARAIRLARARALPSFDASGATAPANDQLMSRAR